MLTLQGIPVNIKEPFLGKVSFSPVEREKRGQIILVNANLSKKELKGYAGLIFSSPDVENQIKACEIPVVCNIKAIDSLSEGDVIQVFPNGKINVLYQINSKHNFIFVTSKCDCNCIMCPQPVDENEGNLTDLNIKLISLISQSTKELALTGGEPTLIGHDLFKLILGCRDLLPSTSLLLLTNGRKFSEFEYTHLFSSLQHPNIMVGIPLYGDNNIEHDAIIGSKGAFNDTIRGILNLASFNNPIEIRTVIHRFTYTKLLRISEFIYRNLTFVKHTAFMGLETIGRAQDHIKTLWVEPEAVISPLKESIRYLRQRDINISIYNIPLCLLPKELWVFARQSISDWKNSFDSECLTCSVKDKCGGIFESGVEIYKKYLRPIS